MARPPQYERKLDDVDPDFTTLRIAAKRLSPRDRAKLLAWLCLYYDDAGQRWGSTIKRQRVALDGEELWVVKIPSSHRASIRGAERKPPL